MQAYTRILVFEVLIQQTRQRLKERVSDRLTTNVVYSDSFILDPSAVTPTPYKTYLLTSGFDPDNALAVANLRIGINSLQCILAIQG